MASDSVRIKVLLAAGSLLGVDVVVICLSYAGVGWPPWVMPLTFVPLFPIFVMGMLIAIARSEGASPNSRRRRLRFRDVLRGTPAIVVVFGALGFYGGLLLCWANLSLAGQPVNRGGAYFLNDHGALTQVSVEGYNAAIAEGIRLFTSGSLAFASVSFLLTFPPIRSGSPAPGKP
jgi:ABC-type amino acid transport system permease subunit